jgi:hypothetical protein
MAAIEGTQFGPSLAERLMYIHTNAIKLRSHDPRAPCGVALNRPEET